VTLRPMPSVHPAASIFPMLPEPELAALAEDIRRTAQRDSIVLWHGQLLDGRNRWMACDRAGVEPKTVTRNDIADPWAFVVSVNIHRRHLDESQRAMAAARAKVAMSAQREPAEGEGLANLQAEPVRDASVAALLKVSPRSVAHARVVLASAIPALVERIDSGATAVSAGAEVARLPKGKQEEIVARGEKEILSMAKQLRADKGRARLEKRTEKLATIAQGNRPLSEGPERFAVVYADPPWRYESGSAPPEDQIENHYPTMTIDDICALPVGARCTEAAILFLWHPPGMATEAVKVATAWGFRERSSWVWVKPSIGPGYWGRLRHEPLLIATRGDFPAPPPELRFDSVIEAPRGEHSAKPAEAAERIGKMFPTLPKVELFARGLMRDGWYGWGNEAGKLR